MKNCIVCNKEIPEGRLKALPNTKTCTEHSQVDKVAGFQLITGKTEYTDLQIVDQETFKRLTKLQDRKGYGVSNGIKFDSDK